MPESMGEGESMAIKMVIALGILMLAASLGGCGYKAPPYYEKPAPAEGSSVAL